MKEGGREWMQGRYLFRVISRYIYILLTAILSYRVLATFHSRELNLLLNYAWLSFTPLINLPISNAWWPYRL